jgi:hypothetical protein
MGKKPKRQTPDRGKFTRPRDTEEASSRTQYPSFSLRYCDPAYCISKCEISEKAAFADQLRILSQKTWAELYSSPRHGIGCEKIIQTLNRPLPSHLQPDQTIIAFRFDGNKPMVGYRDGNIFYIIWFDRDYTLYDHG